MEKAINIQFFLTIINLITHQLIRKIISVNKINAQAYIQLRERKDSIMRFFYIIPIKYVVKPIFLRNLLRSYFYNFSMN